MCSLFSLHSALHQFGSLPFARVAVFLLFSAFDLLSSVILFFCLVFSPTTYHLSKAIFSFFYRLLPLTWTHFANLGRKKLFCSFLCLFFCLLDFAQVSINIIIIPLYTHTLIILHRILRLQVHFLASRTQKSAKICCCSGAFREKQHRCVQHQIVRRFCVFWFLLPSRAIIYYSILLSFKYLPVVSVFSFFGMCSVYLWEPTSCHLTVYTLTLCSSTDGAIYWCTELHL